MAAGEREAVLDLLEAAFEEREVFERYLDFDPAYRPTDFVLAVDGQRPVSCVQIFAKRIRLRGRVVPLGGIGSVATHPDYRRRGLAHELLRRCEQRMRERGMVIGLLFSGLHAFYGQLGWVSIPARQLAVRRRDELGASVRVSLRSFAPSDLDEVRALYDEYSGRFDGTVVRDLDYWDGQLRYAGAPGEDFRVALRGGRIAAYARRVHLDAPTAMEYAHAPGCAELLADLLMELSPARGSLRLRLPPGTELEPELCRRSQEVERADDRSPMWRVLDRGALAALAGLPDDADPGELLSCLVERPPAHYWVSDRF